MIQPKRWTIFMVMPRKETEKQEEGTAVAHPEWKWTLIAGCVLAVIGGALKVHELMNSPPVFEYVFFRGGSYIVMVSGLVVVIVSLGFDLLFDPGKDEK